MLYGSDPPRLVKSVCWGGGDRHLSAPARFGSGTPKSCCVPEGQAGALTGTRPLGINSHSPTPREVSVSPLSAYLRRSGAAPAQGKSPRPSFPHLTKPNRRPRRRSLSTSVIPLPGDQSAFSGRELLAPDMRRRSSQAVRKLPGAGLGGGRGRGGGNGGAVGSLDVRCSQLHSTDQRCPWGGVGEVFLGLNQRRVWISPRAMLPDLRVCPCLQEGGAPRWAGESSRPRFRGPVRLAGVGLLITLLSALGYCTQAPGRAVSSRLHAPGLSSLAMLWRLLLALLFLRYVF